jgi:DNA-binding NarL/FixJ family response regulator
MAMKQALIVDDHPLVCEAVKGFLQTHFPFLELKTSSGGNKLLDELCGTPWAFAVLDIKLSDQSGLDVLRQTRGCCPTLPIIIYSAYAERQYANRALRAGAIAYVSKEHAPDELVPIVRKILEGSKIRKPINTQAALSPRERQVLMLLAQGLRRSEIAQRLEISDKTVSAHQANLLLKLELRNVVELVRYAIEEGFGKTV